MVNTFSENKIHIKQFDNKNQWEQFLLKHSPQSLFQSYAWGEVVNNSKFKAFDSSSGREFQSSKLVWRLGIFEEEKLVGIAQVNKVTAKRGVFLHVRHGPILAEWEREIFKIVIEYLKNLAREEKTWFIRMSPLIENSQKNKDFFVSFGFRSSPIHSMDGEFCWVLDLDKSESDFLSGMRKTTRYLIRQGQKQNIRIKNSFDIDAFLYLYKQTAKRHKFVPHYQVKEEFLTFSKEGKSVLLLGFHEEKLLAGAIIVYYGNQAIYRHGASIPTKIPVSYLLQWESIKLAKEHKLKQYNFWGIAPDNNTRHPWKGITLFKKGFGGRSVSYLHAHDLPLSLLYGITYGIETARRIRKGY